MLSKAELHRYQRHISLDQVGIEGQEKLKSATVLIVGVGGLGCPVAMYLTAAGVGTIDLIDHDLVEETNLQRQVLFNVDDIGFPKVKAARNHLEKINPHVEFSSFHQALDTSIAESLFQQYDIIIDGTDNFQTKYLINDACVRTGKPMVSASIYKFQGQISVFNFRNGPSYRCLFPEHHTHDTNNCEEVGVIGVLPGILGTLQASEVIKIILGKGNVLAGKVKLIDTLSLNEQVIDFDRKEEQIKIAMEQELKVATVDCERIQMNFSELVLDVREHFETPKLDTSNLLHIPLHQIANRHEEIPVDQRVIVCCQSGKRSQKAIELLSKEFGFSNLVNLEGGVQNLNK